MCINEDFVAQGDAGQKGAGQTGPEGPGGDSGEFTRLVTDCSVDFMVKVETDKCGCIIYCSQFIQRNKNKI